MVGPWPHLNYIPGLPGYGVCFFKELKLSIILLFDGVCFTQCNLFQWLLFLLYLHINRVKGEYRTVNTCGSKR